MKMFKQVLHIISFYLLLVLFSCAGESRYEDAVAPAEESKSIPGNNAEFTEELNINKLPKSLSIEQQAAFELRAQQKFQDFLDYLKIVSNPKMDKGLVKHSEELMKELFISDTITITDSSIIDQKESSIKLSRLISLIKQRNKTVNFLTNNIIFSIPLDKDSSNNYKGIMEASVIRKHKTKTIRVDIYLIETTKQFGDTEQKTIEIKLGNIY
ncbi:MAG: hypothetical protein P1U41_00245 [Vicingaceae bacterium]|nr:hypothetical protein [Vicingaceae bacterium]